MEHIAYDPDKHQKVKYIGEKTDFKGTFVVLRDKYDLSELGPDENVVIHPVNDKGIVLHYPEVDKQNTVVKSDLQIVPK